MPTIDVSSFLSGLKFLEIAKNRAISLYISLLISEKKMSNKYAPFWAYFQEFNSFSNIVIPFCSQIREISKISGKSSLPSELRFVKIARNVLISSLLSGLQFVKIAKG